MSRTPPGPTGRPVLGSSRRYAADPLGFLETLEDAYGPVSQFDLGPLATYVVTDPPAIERFLVTAADDVGKPGFGDGAVDSLLGEGMLLGEGEAWERQRALASPSFDPSRIAASADRIVDAVERQVESWSDGDVVDVESEMTTITLRVIVDLMLGVDLSMDRLDHVQAQLEPLGARFEPEPLRFALPEWVPLPGDAEFDAAVAELDTFVDEVIDRRRPVEADGVDADDGDLLAALLRARDDGELTDRQVRDEVVTILLAGHDTTALALTYTWYLLSTHPEAERRLHGEVDEVVDGDRPTVEDVSNLEFTERVVDEAMRLYPPAFVVSRVTKRPFVVDDYEIPADSFVMLPQWAVHRSERHWAAPETFDPDRWTSERSEDRHRFAYFPFGGGPRHCIGKHLATLEAKLVVATLAGRYGLAYLGDEPPALQPSLTTHPRSAMQFRVRRRAD